MRATWTWTTPAKKRKAHAVERDMNRTACGVNLRGSPRLSTVTPREEHACKICYSVVAKRGAS